MQLLAIPSQNINPDKWKREKDFSEIFEINPFATVPAGAVGSGKRKEILLVAAVGQEPRLGRWMRVKNGVKNGALIVHLRSHGDAGL